MGAQSPGQVPMTIGQLAFADAFPLESVGFSHDLHLDDRLSYPSVADLADRLPRRSVIADTAAQPLLVPQGGPPRASWNDRAMSFAICATQTPGSRCSTWRTIQAWRKS